MKKFLSFLLALCLIGSLATFASAEIDPGTVITATPELYANTDLSRAYTVNLYLVGDKPNDWDTVLELVNEELEPYNTKLAVTFIAWSDMSTMYSLVLAGGEQIDLIYTAPWCYMYSEAAKGSFYDLDQDFISTYMPLASQYQAEESWDETTLNGRIVAVPSNLATPTAKIVAVRQDLMEKYGIESLNNFDDYVSYLLTIAEKETPESGIYALAAAGMNNEMWDIYRQQYNEILLVDTTYMDFMYAYQEGGALPTTDDITLVYDTDIFRDYCYTTKELADAGVWSRSALTNTVMESEAFANLHGASLCWNTSVFSSMELAEQTEGVTCAAYDLTKDNVVIPEPYSNNDMAIAAGSDNPERAAMVLDLIKYDTTINRLICLGIEGVHYTIDDEGNYTSLDKASDYSPYGISAAWASRNGDVQEAGTPARETAITDDWKERIVSNPTVTFVFDDSSIKAYTAAVGTVLNDYVPMLELGLVDDVDATLDEMIQKCYDSGLQQVYDELFSQYTAWAATR